MKQTPWQHTSDRVQAMPLSGLLQHLCHLPHKPLQHLASLIHPVQKAPRGVQDDCAATGRGFKLRTATVSITNTAKFLKIRKRDIALLLLTVSLLPFGRGFGPLILGLSGLGRSCGRSHHLKFLAWREHTSPCVHDCPALVH